MATTTSKPAGRWPNAWATQQNLDRVSAAVVDSLTGVHYFFDLAVPLEPAPQERADAAAGCRQMQKDGAGAGYGGGLSSAAPVIARMRMSIPSRTP